MTSDVTPVVDAQPEGPVDPVPTGAVAPHPERPAPTPHANQQRIVMLYTSVPPVMVVDAIRQMRAAGAEVVIIGPQIRGYENAAEVASSNIFLRKRVAPVHFDRDNPPRRYSAEWASIVARNLGRRATYKPAQRMLGAATLWWMATAQNREALTAIDQAHVLTALDGGSVYSIWQAARRNKGAAAINGIGPTMEHLGLSR